MKSVVGIPPRIEFGERQLSVKAQLSHSYLHLFQVSSNPLVADRALRIVELGECLKKLGIQKRQATRGNSADHDLITLVLQSRDQTAHPFDDRLGRLRISDVVSDVGEKSYPPATHLLFEIELNLLQRLVSDQRVARFQSVGSTRSVGKSYLKKTRETFA